MKKTSNGSKKNKKGLKHKGPQPNGISKNGQKGRIKKPDNGKTMFINNKSNNSYKSKNGFTKKISNAVQNSVQSSPIKDKVLPQNDQLISNFFDIINQFGGNKPTIISESIETVVENNIVEKLNSPWKSKGIFA